MMLDLAEVERLRAALTEALDIAARWCDVPWSKVPHDGADDGRRIAELRKLLGGAP